MVGVDLFQSRRNYNERCRWWSRNEDDINIASDLIMKRIPTGYFMAKEISPERIEDVRLADSFLFQKNSIQIQSPDNLEDIKVNDLVEFQEEKWIVANVQKRKAKIQNTQYSSDRNCSHFWILELRK